MTNAIYRLLLAATALLLAASCVPKVEADSITSGSEELDVHDSSDSITILLYLESNISEYVQVSYALKWVDSKTRYGQFSPYPAKTLSTTAGPATIGVAFKAEQIKAFPEDFFSSGNPITFSVTAALSTPSGGVRYTWSGLHNAKITSEKDFNTLVLNAVNEGLPNSLNGTGQYKYIEFTIGKENEENYGIYTRWLNGTLFN